LFIVYCLLNLNEQTNYLISKDIIKFTNPKLKEGRF
jgi:hypothetical protein